MQENRDLSKSDASPSSEARAKRARKKQEQILEGAQRAFLQYGYARASTDLIAQSAGVSKQTLYAHYENKPQLLSAVLRHLLDEVNFPMSAPELGLREALRQLAMEVLRRMMQAQYLALLRVIIAEAPHHPEIAELFVATVPARGLAAISEILRLAQREGMLADVDLEAAGRMFLGSLLTYAILDGLFVIGAPPRLPSEEKVEALVDLVVRAVAKHD
ncbi:hypothetical protein IAD21_04195 [Abditibacteriota bacterium]|nr:hypothetical protein IAD21_04195 [Abditibacteriota bacterium]